MVPVDRDSLRGWSIEIRGGLINDLSIGMVNQCLMIVAGGLTYDLVESRCSLFDEIHDEDWSLNPHESSVQSHGFVRSRLQGWHDLFGDPPGAKMGELNSHSSQMLFQDSTPTVRSSQEEYCFRRGQNPPVGLVGAVN